MTGMEESTGIAEVISVKRLPLMEETDSLWDHVYAIQAKIYLPADKYSNDLFRVKISKPIGVSKRAPSIMNHGRFTFDSHRELKVGKLLEISISPA
jgi:hypothetical protein